MLRVTVDLIPHEGGGTQHIHTLNIGRINITDDGELGDYEYAMLDGPTAIRKHGQVHGFMRNELTAWDLIRLVLADAEVGDDDGE